MKEVCDFELRVKGEVENINTLFSWMRAEITLDSAGNVIEVWDTETGLDVDYYIGSNGIVEIWSDNIDPRNDVHFLSGYCDWSIETSLMSNVYYQKFDIDEEGKAISIVGASKKLNLTIEIFSECTDEFFSEHLLVENGEIKIFEKTDLDEIFVNTLDKTPMDLTYEEFDKKYGDLLRANNEMLSKEEAIDYSPLWVCKFLKNGYQWGYIDSDNFNWVI